MAQRPCSTPGSSCYRTHGVHGHRPTPDLASWYDAHGLPWLPASFGHHLRWLHLLAPGFEAHLDDAALRALPGCTWHDFPDGAASLQTYDDPARFADPEVDAHRRETSERIRQAVR